MTFTKCRAKLGGMCVPHTLYCSCLIYMFICFILLINVKYSSNILMMEN